MNDSGWKTHHKNMFETKRLTKVKGKHHKTKIRHPELTLRKERVELERLCDSLWETST